MRKLFISYLKLYALQIFICNTVYTRQPFTLDLCLILLMTGLLLHLTCHEKPIVALSIGRSVPA